MEKPKKVTAILKVTENCNYNCEFCYYAHKKYEKQKNMDILLCKEIIKKCVNYNLDNDYHICSLIFHGGEPLLRGLDFFKEIISYEKELENEYTDLKFDNTIQTNGSLITDEWIKFFKTNNFIVGISLDGNEELNYHYSNKDNNKNINEIIKKYNKMDETGINVGILSVITNKHCDKPAEFYNFLKENNIKKVSILPCVNDLNNSTVNNQKLTKFYIKFFDLFFNGNYNISIREFNDMIKKVLGYNITTCKNCHRIGCGSFLTFDSIGNIFFCDEAYNKEKILCNIKDKNITDIFEETKYIKEKEKSIKFYNEVCKKCSIKSLCGGDCYRNDICLENDTPQNRFCDVSKVVYPYIEKKVQAMIGNKK